MAAQKEEYSNLKGLATIILIGVVVYLLWKNSQNKTTNSNVNLASTNAPSISSSPKSNPNAFQIEGFWCINESYPLRLTGSGTPSSPFMYGEDTKKLQNWLNSKYNTGLKVHGIFGTATKTSLQKHTGKTQINSGQELTSLTGVFAANTQISASGGAGYGYNGGGVGFKNFN